MYNFHRLQYQPKMIMEEQHYITAQTIWRHSVRKCYWPKILACWRSRTHKGSRPYICQWSVEMCLYSNSCSLREQISGAWTVNYTPPHTGPLVGQGHLLFLPMKSAIMIVICYKSSSSYFTPSVPSDIKFCKLLNKCGESISLTVKLWSILCRNYLKLQPMVGASNLYNHNLMLNSGIAEKRNLCHPKYNVNPYMFFVHYTMQAMWWERTVHRLNVSYFNDIYK